METKENNSEIKPSKPSWGNEISRPSESLELINKNIFHVSTSNSKDPQTISSNLSVCQSYASHFNESYSTKNLSPIEEYLQVTMRLITSKSLSPRTSVILEDLYVKYKLNRGYNSNIDINQEDWTKVIKHYDEYKETFADLEKNGSKENSSTSKKEQLDTESRTLKKTKILMEDTESPWFTLQTVQDSLFERPCDSKIIQINDVFSDFSLADAGHDKTMKELVRQWMAKEEQFLVIAPGQSKKVSDPGGEKERTHNR